MKIQPTEKGIYSFQFDCLRLILLRLLIWFFTLYYIHSPFTVYAIFQMAWISMGLRIWHLKDGIGFWIFHHPWLSSTLYWINFSVVCLLCFLSINMQLNTSNAGDVKFSALWWPLTQKKSSQLGLWVVCQTGERGLT